MRVIIEMPTSHLKNINGTHYGLAKRFVKLSHFFDIIYIIFGTKLYRQIMGIQMGTNCAPLDLFCYERDIILSLSGDKEAEFINASNSTSKYLDDLYDLLNIAYFDGKVN